MLSDWIASADGRKAIEKMGDPVQDLDNEMKYRTSHTAEEQALALLRDRAREWLLEQCGVVETREHGRAVLRKGTACRILQKDWRGAVRISIPRPDGLGRHEYYGADYDKAMIQAILAQKEGDR